MARGTATTVIESDEMSEIGNSYVPRNNYHILEESRTSSLWLQPLLS